MLQPVLSVSEPKCLIGGIHLMVLGGDFTHSRLLGFISRHAGQAGCVNGSSWRVCGCVCVCVCVGWGEEDDGAIIVIGEMCVFDQGRCPRSAFACSNKIKCIEISRNKHLL